MNSQLEIDVSAAKICGFNPTVVEETDRTPSWVGVHAGDGWHNRVLEPFELHDPINMLLVLEYSMEQCNIAFGRLADGKYTALDILQNQTVEVAETLYDLLAKICINLDRGAIYGC